MTIEKYLIPMIENELKKKKLQEKKYKSYWKSASLPPAVF